MGPTFAVDTLGSGDPSQFEDVDTRPAARWTVDEGLRPLGEYYDNLGHCDYAFRKDCVFRAPVEGTANAVSSDGNVVFGYQESHVWTSSIYAGQDWLDLNVVQNDFWLPPNPEGNLALTALSASLPSYGVSSDGTRAVGGHTGNMAGIKREPGPGPLVSTWSLDLGQGSHTAVDLSGDGAVVLGHSTYGGTYLHNPDAEETLFISTTATAGGPTHIRDPQALSADGSTIVGGNENAFSLNGQPVRWNSTEGFTDIPILEDAQTAYVHDVSGDGSLVVGSAHSPSQSPVAFVWDPENGTRRLQDVLETEYGLDLTGWELQEARGTSADGRSIAGWGIDPDGNQQGFLAFLGEERSGAAVVGVGDVAETLLADGGSGGLDITLSESTGGTLSVDYSVISRASVLDLASIGDFLGPDTLSGVQAWEIEYGGSFELATLTFHYDGTGISEQDELELFIYHRVGDEWVRVDGSVETENDTITISTTSFSPFLLAGAPGTLPEPTGNVVVPEPSTILLVTLGLAALRSPRAVRARARSARIAGDCA